MKHCHMTKIDKRKGFESSHNKKQDFLQNLYQGYPNKMKKPTTEIVKTLE